MTAGQRGGHHEVPGGPHSRGDPPAASRPVRRLDDARATERPEEHQRGPDIRRPERRVGGNGQAGARQDVVDDLLVERAAECEHVVERHVLAPDPGRPLPPFDLEEAVPAIHDDRAELTRGVTPDCRVLHVGEARGRPRRTGRRRPCDAGRATLHIPARSELGGRGAPLPVPDPGPTASPSIAWTSTVAPTSVIVSARARLADVLRRERETRQGRPAAPPALAGPPREPPLDLRGAPAPAQDAPHGEDTDPDHQERYRRRFAYPHATCAGQGGGHAPLELALGGPSF